MSATLPEFDISVDISPEEALRIVFHNLLRPTNGLDGCIMLFEKDIHREDRAEIARAWLGHQKSVLVAIKRYLNKKYPDTQYIENELYFGFKELDDV